ncbi:MAG TPA: EAL domain-containing protein [Woeseiaceae bacterium]|nr:EAL domain-containing protein [Woeseiaceae bacterium]
MIRVAPRFRRFAAKLRRGVRRGFNARDKRGLVNEILSLQIVNAVIIGGFAIATLYWGGQWVLKDSYARWALQWTEELNELGAPLYLDDGSDTLLRLESFVHKYPEIRHVHYYMPDGTPRTSLSNQGVEPQVAEPLAAARLALARERIGAAEPWLFDAGVIDARKFGILAPIWNESLGEEALFAADPAAAAPERVDLIGYVGLELDYLHFHDELLGNIQAAVLLLVVLLAVFIWASRRALQRALISISDLQAPIRELALGNLDVDFKPAEHREISDIVEALEKTATALSERDARLTELANQDGLTGLFNRRRFTEELRSELAAFDDARRTSALFFIDLDRFKYVNDSCGHPAGDRLIRRVADELTRSVDADDTVGRFGGDEFVVLLRNTTEVAASAIADTILKNIRRLAHIESERVFHVHCSIGIVMLDGSNRNHDDLIAQADIACREAKAAGRNRIAFFEPSEERLSQASADVGWMNKLRRALDESRFELRFQPINRIDSGITTHHEVLIRLRDDDGRLVNPDAFLPAAIRFGLMSEIDQWIIRAAARACAEYDGERRPLHLSINLSANAFETDDLVRFVEQTFAEFRVDPATIIFEITESLAIRRPRKVEQQIDGLQALGCKLALDDFGTGYSSFGYLQKLRFDFIKIDGVFVQDILNHPVDQKMIRMIAEIGAEAGMQTIAEYVQNAESLALLGELGVDLAQGYFVGRPAKQPQFRGTPIPFSRRRSRRKSLY